MYPEFRLVFLALFIYMVKGILHSQHTLMMKLARCDKLLQQSTKVIGVHCWLMLAWLFVKSCSQKMQKKFQS